MVQVHIGADKGAQALNFLGFILRSSPLSVTRVFLPQRCPDIVQNQLQSLEMEFSKSRLTAVPREWSTVYEVSCQLCDKTREY